MENEVLIGTMRNGGALGFVVETFVQFGSLPDCWILLTPNLQLFIHFLTAMPSHIVSGSWCLLFVCLRGGRGEDRDSPLWAAQNRTVLSVQTTALGMSVPLETYLYLYKIFGKDGLLVTFVSMRIFHSFIFVLQRHFQTYLTTQLHTYF